MSYGSVDINAMNADMHSGNGRRFYKVSPDKGENVFFLPPSSVTGKVPWLKVLAHSKLDKGVVRCLKDFGQHCEACAANNELYNMKNDATAQSISKEIYAQPKFIYNLIPSVINNQGVIMSTSNDPKNAAIILPYMASKTVQELLISIYLSNGDVFDPMSGLPIHLVNIKSGANYRTFPSIQSSVRGKLSDQLMQLITAGIPDLSQVVPTVSAEQMKHLVDARMASFRMGRVTVSNPGIPAQSAPQLPPMTNTIPNQIGNPFVTQPNPQFAGATATAGNPFTQTVVPSVPQVSPPPPVETPPVPTQGLDMSVLNSCTTLEEFKKKLAEGKK